ncbi:MAG: tyrosinase family protein [Labilithrix sp.]|nr:tyrosinase family protein [Labilithrix sp.]
MRVRKSVWGLASGDETLYWYGRAVAEMRRRPIVDPTSWRFQAAIHEYVRAWDPLAEDGEELPSEDEQARYWTQCQHASWYFLPWHRMYLHQFERIVAAEVKKLGGPDDWALPYWNYSAGAPSRLLPAAFRVPASADNPLYLPDRDPACNAGEPFADARDVDLGDCLDETVFEHDPASGGSSFAGAITAFSHAGAFAAHGVLERVPHGSMHGAVGGESGWMGSFHTAALDPIFWLHHANIDRVWEVWRRLERGATNENTADDRWLEGVSFGFFDVDRMPVEMRAKDVVSIEALGYAYDDTSDPLPALAAAMKKAPVPKVAPRLVGATPASTVLDARATRVVVPVQPPAAAAAPRRVFLNIENMTASSRAPSYDVYLNVPESDDPAKHPELFAGRLSMFGLMEASRASAQHAGSGLNHVLDVTRLVRRLANESGWDPSKLRVSFVPSGQFGGAPVTVGRVSLYYQ